MGYGRLSQTAIKRITSAATATTSGAEVCQLIPGIIGSWHKQRIKLAGVDCR
jgi:hypothetical protein